MPDLTPVAGMATSVGAQIERATPEWGQRSPLEQLCLEARFQRDVTGDAQVLVLLDAKNAGPAQSDMPQIPNAQVTWLRLCQGDCLSVDDLCLALGSGFDRVYVQLSADVTQLAGQLRRAEKANARLLAGQVVSLFHSVEGLVTGLAEQTGHPMPEPPVSASQGAEPPGRARGAQLAIFATDCTYCGQCAWVCPTGALLHGDGLLSVEDATCIACGVCVAACPTRALNLVAS